MDVWIHWWLGQFFNMGVRGTKKILCVRMFSTQESRTLVSVLTNTLKQDYRSGVLRLVWKPGETSPACQIVLPD